jgi:hypothetical protein
VTRRAQGSGISGRGGCGLRSLSSSTVSSRKGVLGSSPVSHFRRFAIKVSKITHLRIASLPAMLLHWRNRSPQGRGEGVHKMYLLHIEHRISVEQVAQTVMEEYL